MPTYEYQCVNCNHVQQRDFSISKKKKWTKCEKCGKRANSIISTVSGFVKEGSDFFTKDAKL